MQPMSSGRCRIFQMFHHVARALKEILVCDCRRRVDAVNDHIGFEMREKLIQRRTPKDRFREFIHDIVDVHPPQFRIAENILAVHVF